MSIRFLHILGLVLAGVLVASCTASDTSPSTSSSTVTTSSTTTTTTLPVCTGVGWSVDLDGVEGDESVLVSDLATGGIHLEICRDRAMLASIDVDLPGTEALGVVDLGDGGILDVLLTTTVGDRVEVRAVTLGLTGLTLTDVLAERWMDAPYDGVSLFEAAGFECDDIDDDGHRELLTVTYLPADAMDTEDIEHVRVGVVLLDGEARVEGIDAYEVEHGIAYDRFDDDPRCAPGSEARVEVVIHANMWGRLDAGETFASPGNLVMTGIAHSAGLGRFVMVGAESPTPLLGEFFEARPSIWHSVDAITWVAADLGGAIGEVRAVTALPDGGGFVAVGSTGAAAQAWFSADGVSWEAAELPAGSSDEIGLMGPAASAVIATPIGIVAVGVEDSAPFAGGLGVGSDLDAAVWVSTDGLDWERVIHPALGIPGYQPNTDGEFNSELIDVTWAPGIGLVAVGSASESDPSIDYPMQPPAVWVSEDGVDWQMHRIDDAARLRGIAAFDGTLVVFGVDGLEGSPLSDAAVLVSTDGVVWERAAGEFAGVSEEDGIQAVNGAAVVPGVGLVAFGSDEIELEARGGAAVWRSTDGRLWEREEHHDGAFEAVDVAPTATMTSGVWDGESLVVVGFTGRLVEYSGGITGCCILEPAVWYWPVGGPRNG